MPQAPSVRAFFDEPTNTISYLVGDPATKRAAIIDPVLDYDPASGRSPTAFGRRHPRRGGGARD